MASTDTTNAGDSPQWHDLLEAEALQAMHLPVDPTGEIIGPYRVLRSLGQGGMGEVFLAERADQQFQQRVAIKLVRRGLLSKQVQSRLLVERQILASLEHPNIARLLDGGSTKDGTPYIVMEYVDGKPIDEYCDERRLTINQRLELFRSVCAAVHSAHQNLIVHRDLKPSNILVTFAGIPKLLDFGIAKMLDTRQLSQTVALTQADVRVLTPDHASPEQLSGDLITTASDTYVLGVLLYELLTGCKPFTVKGQSFAELERIICEEPPPPPSQVFSRADTDLPLEEIAANRSSTTARLKRELQGDLGSIILMALRKEPERRYSSVRQFSDDIGRYLQGLPVNARMDTWAYRSAKFVKRHAVVVGLGTVLLATLVGFTANTYLTSIALRTERDVAEAQRVRANNERETAQAISNVMIGLFNNADPDHVRGEKLTALEILDSGAEWVFSELANQKEPQAVLLNTIGQIYGRLGSYEKAQPLLEKSWHIFHQELQIETPVVADVALNLGELHLRTDLNKAEEFTKLSMNIGGRLEGPSSRSVARGECGLGIIYRERNQLDLAERQFHKCIGMYEALGNVDDSHMALALDDLARTLARRGKFAEAEEIYRRWLALNPNLEPDNTRLMQQQQSLATVLQAKGALQEAEEIYRQNIAATRKVFPDSETLVVVLMNHGSVLQELSRFEAADRSFKQALALVEKIRAPAELRAYLNGRMAGLALDRGQTSRAESLYQKALNVYSTPELAESRFTATVLTGLSKTLLQKNEPKNAESHIRKAMRLLESGPGTDIYSYGLAQAILGRALWLQKKPTEAVPLLTEGYQKYVAQRSPEVPEARLIRGWVEDLGSIAAPGAGAS